MSVCHLDVEKSLGQPQGEDRTEGQSQGQPGPSLCVMDPGGTSSGWHVPPSAGAARLLLPYEGQGVQGWRSRGSPPPAILQAGHPLPWGNGGTGEVPVDGTP